ncbi:MAG: hypothetical protein SFZ24_08485 [Planctomycetota bacterium]|nr:hypothetical protein [Planctomycetota bacterium]
MKNTPVTPRNLALCAFLALPLAGLAGLAGCASGDDDGGSWWGGSSDRPYDGVPSGAKRVERGRGMLSHRADRDGTIWVTDDTDRRQIFSQTVSDGDRVEVRPDDNQVRLNEQIVYDRDLTHNHTHAIYFIRADRDSDSYRSDQHRSDGTPSSERNTNVTDRDPGRVASEPAQDNRVNSGSTGSNNNTRTNNNSGSMSGTGGSSTGMMPDELRSAQRVAGGQGDIEHRFTQAGRVWIYDTRDNQVMFRSAVQSQDRLIVRPDRNAIEIQTAGQPVGRTETGTYNLRPDREYAIYYQPR